MVLFTASQLWTKCSTGPLDTVPTDLTPDIHDGYTGHSYPVVQDFVDTKFYKLASIRQYWNTVSRLPCGFEATWTSSLSGYLDITKTYGDTSGTPEIPDLDF